MIRTTITAVNANQRIDKFVRKWLNDAPLSFIYRLFRKKDVKVNGHWAPIDRILAIGDEVTIFVTTTQLEEFNRPKPIEATAFPHQIIYEDDQCLIVNKPKGLLVHGDDTEKRKTLTNQVLGYLKSTGYNIKQAGYTPAPAHRLDRNTSGLVIFGKSLSAQQKLEHLFHDRVGIKKSYLALVVGRLDKGGEIKFNLEKDQKTQKMHIVKPGRGLSAWTVYEVKERIGPYTLLEVFLKTGRTHQIRAHLAGIGHPIVGDRKYGDFDVNRLFMKSYGYEHQFLHAYKLEFENIGAPLQALSSHCFNAPMPLAEHGLLGMLKSTSDKGE